MGYQKSKSLIWAGHPNKYKNYKVVQNTDRQKDRQTDRKTDMLKTNFLTNGKTDKPI